MSIIEFVVLVLIGIASMCGMLWYTESACPYNYNKKQLFVVRFISGPLVWVGVPFLFVFGKIAGRAQKWFDNLGKEKEKDKK